MWNSQSKNMYQFMELIYQYSRIDNGVYEYIGFTPWVSMCIFILNLHIMKRNIYTLQYHFKTIGTLINKPVQTILQIERGE